MADPIQNKTFYAAIAGCLVGLFAMLVVPCFIAMCVARCREKRQRHRDALAGEGSNDDSTDYLVYGPFPYGSAIYHVDEVGESSGYRAPQNSVEDLDSAIQLNAALEDDAALALAQQEDGTAITSIEQEHDTGLDDLREPQYEGKGKAPMYSQIQAVVVEQQEQQLSENAQVQLLGSFQEGVSNYLPSGLAEATAKVPAELPAEPKAAEEYQDAPEVVPEATPANNEQQLLTKKEDQA
jgi:hypothetical protein